MKKGVLLIAIGHPNYVKMAANLAASIHFNSDIPICLATDQEIPGWLTEKGIITIVKKVPQSYYTTAGNREYIKVKTRMYDLSPFDETIFLDVDMLWLKRDINILFESLKSLEFTMANTGLAGSSVWADIKEVRKAYKSDKPYYNYHSEFVYFKKADKVKVYFDKVKEVYDKPKVKGTNFGGARIADELAFQIASMVLNYYPHAENFLPTYWWGRDKASKENYKFTYQLADKYFAYSIGGNHTPPNIAKNYNNLASFYSQKLGLAKPWFVQNKKSFIPERQTI